MDTGLQYLKMPGLEIFAILAICIVANPARGQQDTTATADIRKFQNALNTFYKSQETSPLNAEQRGLFQSHDFFEIDLHYRVVGKMVVTPTRQIYDMKTTKGRTRKYLKAGTVFFSLLGKDLQLTVYRLEGDDTLFLPFTDLTSGETSYAGGRFIDLEIPAGESLLIDFNKAYNPYCVYNTRFACEIPPPENHLEIAIPAGVRFLGGH